MSPSRSEAALFLWVCFSLQDCDAVIDLNVEEPADHLGQKANTAQARNRGTEGCQDSPGRDSSLQCNGQTSQLCDQLAWELPWGASHLDFCPSHGRLGLWAICVFQLLGRPGMMTLRGPEMPFCLGQREGGKVTLREMSFAS